MNRKKLLTIVVLVVIAAGKWYVEQRESTSAGGSESIEVTDGALALEQAFSKRLHDEWIEAELRITRLLSDDHDGSRHQRFIASTTRDQSLLIAHNIDLADRVPVAIGDRIRVRGVYEWNERGGVLHWTHHDPQGRLEGGYIQHQRKQYR